MKKSQAIAAAMASIALAGALTGCSTQKLYGPPPTEEEEETTVTEQPTETEEK